jgi:hypothetical protein
LAGDLRQSRIPAYERIIGEWLANGRKTPVPSPRVADIKSDASSSRSVTNGETVSPLPVGKITIHADR